MSRGIMEPSGINSELGYLLKEVQQLLRNKMDRALASIDLTTPQYAVLAELEQFPGLSNADLARKSFVTPQTMNLIVQKLEERGLIQRTASESHGKILKIATTARGLEHLSRAHEQVFIIEREVFGKLTKQKAAVLGDILRELRD
jgi:DNA-binding MarR family transcriptional regulator